MAENRFNLLEKVAKVGIIGGLSLLPVLSNGQSIFRDKINWTREQKNPYSKYTLLINSQKPLSGLSGYQSAPAKEYMPGGNLNLYNYNYRVPEDSIKGEILNYIKYMNICPECPECKVKKRPAPKRKSTTKPTPNIKTPEKKVPIKKPVTPVKPNNLEKQEPSISYAIETNTTNNVTNNTTNNYYLPPEEVKKSNDIHQDTLKKSSLEFRTLIEGSKRIAKNNLGGVSINPQIVEGPFGTGPYVEFNFGNVTNIVSTPVYQKTLLNQNLGLFTETEGERVESYKLKYSWGAGWRASVNLNKKGNLRASASYGVIKKTDARSGIREKGFDRIIQNDKVTDEKPYDIELEKGVTSESWEQVGRVGIEYQPSGKVPLYLKAEVQNIGPIGAKNSETSFNATLGLNIGGGKKSK